MNQPIDMRAEKARLERKKYAALVLSAFDKQEAPKVRERKEQCADLQRANRKRL